MVPTHQAFLVDRPIWLTLTKLTKPEPPKVSLDARYGKTAYAWQHDPWVWCLTLRKVQPQEVRHD